MSYVNDLLLDEIEQLDNGIRGSQRHLAISSDPKETERIIESMYETKLELLEAVELLRQHRK